MNKDLSIILHCSGRVVRSVSVKINQVQMVTRYYALRDVQMDRNSHCNYRRNYREILIGYETVGRQTRTVQYATKMEWNKRPHAIRYTCAKSYAKERHPTSTSATAWRFHTAFFTISSRMWYLRKDWSRSAGSFFHQRLLFFN